MLKVDWLESLDEKAKVEAGLDNELKEITNKDVFLVLTPFDTRETLERIGYSVDKQGFIVDKKSKTKVDAEDDKTINIYTDKHFALISGSSHIFVRNVAGFSQYLAEHGLLKFREE
jgi:hypothetical protein